MFSSLLTIGEIVGDGTFLYRMLLDYCLILYLVVQIICKIVVERIWVQLITYVLIVSPKLLLAFSSPLLGSSGLASTCVLSRADEKSN